MVSVIKGLIKDTGFLAAIALLSLFLVGNYLRAEYLSTGYPDWLYHAYRIKSALTFGISSWEHSVASGISQWKAYQYIPHFLTIAIKSLTGASITRSMLILTVLVFVGLRLISYLGMRLLNISATAAFIAVIISLNFAQQWQNIKDFSIFIASILVPVFIIIWAKSLDYPKLRYLVAAIAGFSWTIHPVVGFTLTCLFGLSSVTQLARESKQSLIGYGILFLLASAPFVLPYLLKGYTFANPILNTSTFFRITLPYDYLGLSLTYAIALFFCWVTLVWKNTQVSLWLKSLLLYTSLMLGIIWLGKQGFTPAIINQLQISRANTAIGLMLPFVFAGYIDVFLKSTKSFFVRIIITILVAAVITQGIDQATSLGAAAVNQVQSPVASYFADKPAPYGLVYSQDISEDFYLSYPKVRFISSYNEHLLPSPISFRFKTLMKPDLGYTGVSQKQIDVLTSYIDLLGIQYLFLPPKSPFAEQLVDRTKHFTQESIMLENNQAVTVLVNNQPVHFAYMMEADLAQAIINFEDLPQPTLRANSHNLWDEVVSRLATDLDNQAVVPVPVSFINNNRLKLDLASANQFTNPQILITQNYDPNWRVDNYPELEIEPTSLRFMFINLPTLGSNTSLYLSNNWPAWHWPVQSLGLITVSLTLLATLIYTLITELQKPSS